MQSSKWADFDEHTKKSVDIITNDAEAEQIRPLMLAVSIHFPKDEAERCFTLFLSWVVRFLICGGGGGGKLSRYYGLRAAEVTSKQITTAAGLRKAMTEVIPSDRQFEEAFSAASVRKDQLARYYLRAFEAHKGNDPLPQLLINENPKAVNLEHILPINPADDWGVDPQTAKAFYRRIGNLALLRAGDNVRIGNRNFAEKRATLASSPFEWTKEVAQCHAWGADQIRDCQRRLAALAPKVWPL